MLSLLRWISLLLMTTSLEHGARPLRPLPPPLSENLQTLTLPQPDVSVVETCSVDLYDALVRVAPLGLWSRDLFDVDRVVDLSRFPWSGVQYVAESEQAMGRLR